MFKKTLVASAIGGLLVAPLAAAAPVTVSDSQSITSAGQLFNFNFLSLPTTGTAGQLRITLDGDYSGFDSEAASVTLDVAGGTLRIGDSTQVNGVTSNTISGLTVGSYNSSTASFNDTQQNWVFDLSDSLLAALLADGTLSVAVQNDSGVDVFGEVDPDFVTVRLDFNSGAATGSLAFNPKGIGHIQYVPYFSTQEGNVTAVSIVNTDTVNGKVLKVRFRGASNSDDVYDFQVFLSPGDVWTAGIAQGSDGRSRLDTADKSCTLPANVNGAFITSRTPAAGGVAETREGYIEILTMADIVQGSPGSDQRALYTATKHVKAVAPCTASVLTALTHENASDYMAPPTTGIMANWSIINVNRIVAYSGAAAAIEARDAAGEAGPGRLVYWDQRSVPLSVAQANANTADPLLRGASPAIVGARYDLPDLSTPYLPDLPICPFCQARALSDAIAAQEIAAEYYNEASLGAQTDVVVSFPTRRYFAAVKYGTPNTIVRNATSDGNIYFTADNTELGNAANGGQPWQICARLGVNAVAFYDREETPTVIDDIVISPGTPTSLSICGEVTVVGVNNTSASDSATFGSVARSNVANGFTAGWGSLTVPSENGLPMLARQFLRINNTQTNVYYGMSFPARVVVPGFPAPFVPAP